ncbi:phage tail protein [Escherichia coli]|nr:phage tail protein [Escherichia coli]
MNRSDSPKKQPKPFGVNGQRVAILPTTPAGDNSASYEQGFPPITMILKSAGGLPPKGQDMNQILYELSALGRWSSTGALNTFDSEFASEISGYPSGAMLISNDGERIFINTTEGNLSDPNSNGAGWKDILSYLDLGEAAKRNVGTGANQIPDMSLFASSNTATAAAQKFPSGLILQCGQLNGSPNVSSTYGMRFPMTFSRVLAVTVTLNVTGASGQPTVSATNVHNTGFDITVSPGSVYSASADAYYIAMGY